MSRTLISALPLLLIACSGEGANSQTTTMADKPFKTSVIADFDSPWAMTFLPDGRALVTEKAGDMILFDPKNGTKIPVAGIPKVDSAGQGALMDVVLSPRFAKDKAVYFSFSEERDGLKGVALAKGAFNQASDGTTKLDGVTILFRASPYVDGDGHYSGRIAFSPDGKYLFFTNGERQKFDPAQDPKSTLGKVLRLNLDGTPAANNPLSAKGFNPAIWSYGHRNLLGIAFDKDGRLWEQEMGPKGGDEVNLIKPGLNYGYPKVSNGSHYDGRDIPDHAPGDGFEAPKVWWNPVISPGGLLYYSGDLFPQWKNSLFIGGLSSQSLVRVKLNGEKAEKADQWDMGARIREVEQGPDGALWLLEDGGKSQGRMLKLTPAG
ncbi:PQQ-dependent sugar dehydrogenase [Sphingobium limneticum]|uniref:PQQ-dependent sugar dehydrogenase n=1 Tax=Sphingobium limneticum TaxID=1007511 RepID=A0A5J5HZ27_9SPHN|nr:PQQ-dependent sugar dehydrogenase [Sphingobium limneticum]KAA9015864.1 PQQ-dependent sugar dehydrogenase [Sphingobium limneticum]KAA9028277.1 PQQ-dependent sugar dehydrogenase [Sphingobium limneticum]